MTPHVAVADRFVKAEAVDVAIEPTHQVPRPARFISRNVTAAVDGGNPGAVTAVILLFRCSCAP